MFGERQIRELAPRFKALEEAEPIAAAWRYHENETPYPQWRQQLWECLRRGKERLLAFQGIARPYPAQVVIFPLAATPSTKGTVIPILRELYRRGEPAFLLTRPATRRLLEEGLHRGHLDLGALTALPTQAERRKARARAETTAMAVQVLLAKPDAAHSRRWLEQGYLMEAAMGRWLAGAGAFVMDSDITGFQKGMAQGARAAGVPSVVIQHGLLSEQQFPTSVDRWLCWGEHFKRQAERSFGLPAGKAVVTGCPRWDPLPAMRALPRDPAVRARLGGREDRPLVLLLSSTHGAIHFPEHFNAFFRSVQALADADLDIAVRFHPSEPGLEIYREHLPEQAVARLRPAPPELDLYGILRHVDIVFQVDTAAVIEAMLLGVPVLHERAGNAPPLNAFADEGGGRWSGEERIVEDCLALFREDHLRCALLDEQTAFLQRMLAHQGRATMEAVDLLDRLIAGGRP